MRRAALGLIAGLSLALVAFGHLGALHPAGDSVAIASPVIAVFGLTAAVLLRAKWIGAVLAGWLAVWGYQVLAPSGPAGELLLYQKNLYFRNSDLAGVARDIQDSGADIVTLQEVSDGNKALLALLEEAYPHQHVCDFWRWADLAVLSQHPIAASGCSDRRAMAWARVDKGGQGVTAVSMHLPWPYPYTQASRLRSIEADLVALPRPVVIGADLNTFPNTRVPRRVARLTETQELRQLIPTLFLRGLPLYLDHILAPGGKVERRPLLGSDHFGLLGRLRLE